MIDTVEAREKSGSETLVPLEKSQSQYAHVSVKSIQAQKGTEKSKGTVTAAKSQSSPVDNQRSRPAALSVNLDHKVKSTVRDFLRSDSDSGPQTKI
jgi:hypothetical protein